jgi:hypothetical protein
MVGGSSVSDRFDRNSEPASRQHPERRTTLKFHAGQDNLAAGRELAASDSAFIELASVCTFGASNRIRRSKPAASNSRIKVGIVGCRQPFS